VVALWHIDSKTSELRTENIHPIQHQIFKSKYSMISTGTERMVASGLVDDAFQGKMKVPHQMGSFNLPIKYGYSLIVEDDNGKFGHLMHPHQDQVDVNKSDVFWIDNEIPAHRFALISNIETIVNAIWDSNPSKTDKIAICGFGNIGSLLANTLRTRHEINSTIIEKDSWRISKAKELGWNIHEDDQNYDIIYHTTATESGLQFCIDHLDFEGKVIELSWYGNKKVNINLGRDFHYNRLKIISSQVSHIPGHLQQTYTYGSRKKLALDILQDNSFDDLITHRIPFSDTPDFFKDLRKGRVGDGLIYLIEY